jgi:microcystin-dependent protein
MSTTINGDTITTNNITINSNGTAPTVLQSDNSNKIATTAFVNDKLGSLAGIIVMWSGGEGSVPPGWVLCNGQNSTPNLQGRFIIGYSTSSYGIGQTGGQSQVTLSTAEIPSHNHVINIQDPGHTHNYTTFREEGGGGGKEEKADADDKYQIQTTTSQTGITANSDQIGGSGSHENMPPYYVLAYIMKT